MKNTPLFGLVRAQRWAPLLAVSASLLLAACGDRKDGASPTAARVGKTEITQAHVNAVLQQQRNLRPEQFDELSDKLV